MKRYQLTILSLIGVVAAACSQDQLADQAEPTGHPIEINLVDAGLNPLSRATTTLDYSTQFEESDRAGLYAVKAGSIVGGVENIALTYTDGKWTPATAINYSDALAGATFYAYYPYTENPAFDASQEAPLSEMIRTWTIANDLSTAEAFDQGDLMVGASEAVLESGRYTMTIAMAHQMAMLVVELPSTKYTFTNTDVTLLPYTMEAQAPSFAVVKEEAEEAVKPYYVAENSTYRLLVPANTPYKMVGRFTMSGKNRKYTIEFAEGLTPGVYEHYVIDGGISEKQMELNVGDYFCADGSLADYTEGGTTPSNAIGVIYQLGTTEGIQAELPHCSHAMVYALARTERGTAEGVNDNTDYGDDAYLSIWSTESATSSEDALDWAYSAGLATATGKFRGNESVANGYEMTQAWLGLAPVGEKNLDLIQIMRATHANAVVAPGNTTGWFLPSLYEMKQLNGLVNLLNPSFAAASGEAMWTGAENYSDDKNFFGYWTSTMRARNAVSGYKPGQEDATAAYNNRKAYYRFALAF